jgi:hypothetical protein
VPPVVGLVVSRPPAYNIVQQLISVFKCCLRSVLMQPKGRPELEV